jgi:hypothetical protein
MPLIAIAADKGSPGVTTASVALAAIWPRPVLLAECDPSGADLAYRLPAANGGPLDPRRGLLNVAVAARRGLAPHQVWEHVQKLHGGLDILAGVSGAEQGAGLELLWGAVGKVLAAVPQADVIADCGRLGTDGPIYDLLAEASSVLLLTRATVGEVIRLRDRATALATALGKRGRPAIRINVVVVADYKNIGFAVEQVGQALRQGGAPGHVIGGLAYEPKSAEQLRGEWGGKLDKSMFIRTARAIAADLMAGLPELAQPALANPGLAQPGLARPNGQPAGGPPPQGQPQPSYPPPAWPVPQPPQHASGAAPGPPYQPGPPSGPYYAVAEPPVGAQGTGPQSLISSRTSGHPTVGPDAGPQHMDGNQGTGPGPYPLPHRPGRGRHAGRRGGPPQPAAPEPAAPQQQPEPLRGHPGGR